MTDVAERNAAISVARRLPEPPRPIASRLSAPPRTLRASRRGLLIFRPTPYQRIAPASRRWRNDLYNGEGRLRRTGDRRRVAHSAAAAQALWPRCLPGSQRTRSVPPGATLEHPALVVRGANAAAEDVGAVLAPARPGVPRVTLPACGLLPHD